MVIFDRQGDIKLGIVSVELDRDLVSAGNVSDWEGINCKKDRSKDRALRNSEQQVFSG